MKTVSILFWTVVVAIGVTFSLSIYKAVTDHQAAQNAPRTMPTPALPS